ncbi:MAG: EF-hand domain-containing protein [Promethearchaeota archaeon]|jgi:Ca2+-binding EF-hand superfamily protein
MPNLSKEEIARIKSIFNQFDKNKNDTIEKAELQTLSIALNDPLSPAELFDFFKQIDENNNGIISWDEFIRYWNKP